jgi:murein DD-endopeptidase MepM/ murein hydrolase activator NlpD
MIPGIVNFLLGVFLAQAVSAPRDLQVRVLPENPKQGQLVVIEVWGAEAGDELRGRFLNRKLRFFSDGQHGTRALTAVPLRAKPGKKTLSLELRMSASESMFRSQPVMVAKGQFGTQTISVAAKYVRPPEEVRKRIQSEGAEIKKLWQAAATRRMWRGSFVWPRKDRVGSPFGLKRVFNGRLKSRHFGVDIRGKMGSPVAAIGVGRVVMVADRYYSGNTVVIDHGLRLFSLYFHLSKADVKKGQRVKKGQIIGRVGSTGRSTGPHLHMSTKIENLSFDPLSLLAFDFNS